jgi:hypothetical protein
MEPFATFQREWPVIANAPWSAMALFASGLGIGWGAAWIHFRGRIETLDGRVKLKDDHLAALRGGIENAPNDEAAIIAAKAELAKQERLRIKQGEPLYLVADDGLTDTLQAKVRDRLDENHLDWIAPRSGRRPRE